MEQYFDPKFAGKKSQYEDDMLFVVQPTKRSKIYFLWVWVLEK